MESPQIEQRGAVLPEAHLRDYWKVVWQGRWTIVAVFLVVVGATAVWTFLQTPIYRATATVEIQPQARRLAAGRDVSGLGAAGYGWFAEEKYHNTQVEIIKSRDVALRVVEELDLRTDPMFEAATDPVEAFRQRIQVDPRRETGLIEISIAGADRDEITRWVNSVAHAYVDRNLEKATDNVSAAITAIKSHLEPLKEDLLAAEDARVKTLGSEQIYNSENQEEIVRQRLKTLNSELTGVEIARNRLSETLRQIRDLQASSGDLLSLPELAGDKTLQELYRNKDDLERKLESAKVELRPGHPEYESILSEIQKVKQRIDEATSQILGKLDNEHDKLRRSEEFLKEQIQAAEEFSLSVVKATSYYDIVKTDSETKRMVFDLVSKAMNEVTLGMQLMTNNVSVLDDAQPPLYPLKPRRRLNLMVGAFFGLCLGLGVVFFVDYLDNTFRTPEDIEKYLGLAVLGVIPKIQPGESALSNRAVKEAFQSLRTSIIFSSKSRQRRVVLVTSSGPQEGKSSMVANLGRMLAQGGERVIVVDCDMRRPTQHIQLEADREAGLTNYLAAPADRADWRVCVKTAGPSNLHVITCGPIPPSPPELLSSERFEELLSALRENYDWVLIDSPPASSLADATLLASASDMAVLVVRHNQTDRDLVAKTLQRLRSVNPAIVGAVLNNVDIDRAYNKDSYYAGYYYYGEEGKGSLKKKRRIEPTAKVG